MRRNTIWLALGAMVVALIVFAMVGRDPAATNSKNTVPPATQTQPGGAGTGGAGSGG